MHAIDYCPERDTVQVNVSKFDQQCPVIPCPCIGSQGSHPLKNHKDNRWLHTSWEDHCSGTQRSLGTRSEVRKPKGQMLHKYIGTSAQHRFIHCYPPSAGTSAMKTMILCSPLDNVNPGLINLWLINRGVSPLVGIQTTFGGNTPLIMGGVY